MENINIDSNLVLLGVVMLVGAMMSTILAIFVFQKTKSKEPKT
jgi:hypothetical protein